MGRLAIRKVEYSGDKYEFSSPDFPDGLVLIEGGNGSGKTTFADLIYFALGGHVKQFAKKGNEQHKEIKTDTNNFVRIVVEIGGRPHSLTRRFDAPQDVMVAGLSPDMKTGNVEVFPVKRTDDRRTLSDWILELLGINAVTLFTGSYRGRLNFTDLMRLIYHDQDPDPGRVFMKLETDNFVTDSRDFRRAVFEILIGTSSAHYYEALGKLRLAERAYAECAAALAAYKGAVQRVAPEQKDANTIFLRERIAEREQQLERLYHTRVQLRKTAPSAASSDTELTKLRHELTSGELELSSMQRAQSDLMSEKARLANLEEQLIDEVVRVQKIIHAHETLSLFSPDTCPCCLRQVDRARDRCICGQSVSEDSYQRFFYSADEYLNILKSKQKNVETVVSAIAACKTELETLENKEEVVKLAVVELRKRIAKWAGLEGTYGTQLESVDDKIVDVRVELERLKQQLDMEIERNKLEAAEQVARENVSKLSVEVQRFDLEAQTDRETKIARFNSIYTQLMSQTLANVRVARLDGEYGPVLNDGEYREASATVTRRLMYYLTLLQLSFGDKVPFPRFLLVDTPETAGIDRENLSRAIGKIPQVLKHGVGQVILTTGKDRYPKELQKYRKVTLTEKAKLLRPRG